MCIRYRKYGVTLISCGNGTASRESEQIISDMIKEYNLAGVDYVITNEAGASVYSASKLATEEFPDFDVNQSCLLYTSVVLNRHLHLLREHLKLGRVSVHLTRRLLRHTEQSFLLWLRNAALTLCSRHQ